MFEIIPNFSWIEQDKLAGSSFPWTLDNLQFLIDNNIQVIVNLTENTSYPEDTELLNRFTLYHLPTQDFSIPTISQISKFWYIYQKHSNRSEPILIHCIAGCGRTGIFLVSWLILKRSDFTVHEALRYIRKDRPCSVETLEQERFLNQVFLQREEILKSENR